MAALLALGGEAASAAPMPAGSGPFPSEARLQRVRDVHVYTAPPPPSIRVFPGTGACYGGPYCGAPYSYAVPYEDRPFYVPHGAGWRRSLVGKPKTGGIRCTAGRAAGKGCGRMR